MGDSLKTQIGRAQKLQIKMKLLSTLAVLGLAASTFGAPQYYQPYGYGGQYGGYGGQYNRYQTAPAQPLNSYNPAFAQVVPQPAVITRTAQNTVSNAPLGLTVDFDSSFGTFPLGSKNELTPTQRDVLLPVMEALLKTLETDEPSAEDMNTLMIQVRNLLKTVPEGDMPDLSQFGFDGDFGMGMDLDTLKNVALPETGDIVVSENGQNKVITGFGAFPLKSYMNQADRLKFLPAIRGFTNLLKKDVLNKAETEELLGHVRKLDSWGLFPFDVRDSNEPKKKKGFGTTFNLGALSGLIGGLLNAQMSESLEIFSKMFSFLSSINTFRFQCFN